MTIVPSKIRSMQQVILLEWSEQTLSWQWQITISEAAHRQSVSLEQNHHLAEPYKFVVSKTGTLGPLFQNPVLWG